MNKIIINRGSFKLDEVVFEQGTTTIGRAGNNAVVLDDNAVSSHHAKIITLFNSSYIEDLDSTNGTLVNGKAIQKRTLRSGDIISLGNHQLLFQSDEARSTDETSDTLMLRGSEIKEKLSEFLQAQLEVQQNQQSFQESPAPDAIKSMAAPEKNLNNLQDIATNPAPVRNNSSTVGNNANPSLDKEKNRAWLEGKNIHSLEPKAPPAGNTPLKTNPNAQTTESSISDQERQRAAAIRRNTAAAIKAATNKNAPPPRSTGTRPQAQKNSKDIAAAARSALHGKRPAGTHTATKAPPDSTPRKRPRHGGAGVSAQHNTMTLGTGRSGNKFLPMIWLIIAAVLIGELIYITYRSMGQ